MPASNVGTIIVFPPKLEFFLATMFLQNVFLFAFQQPVKGALKSIWLNADNDLDGVFSIC
jgi:hypothetical protein